jgi:uracil-DNA glycosylase
MGNVKSISLNVISEEAKLCTKCILCENRNNSVFSSGPNDANIMFIGEAGGRTENQNGVPFCGRAGKLLNNMIASMKLNRDDVYVTNICKCSPPNNRKPLPEEISACLPYLTRQIDIIIPKVIVTLGATAMEALLGPGLGITKRRGAWGKYQGIPVKIVFHPSYLLRNPPGAKADTWNDLQDVVKVVVS